MINESKEKNGLTHILVTGPLVQGNMDYVGAPNMIVISVVKKVLASTCMYVAANHGEFFIPYCSPSEAGGGYFMHINRKNLRMCVSGLPCYTHVHYSFFLKKNRAIVR